MACVDYNQNSEYRTTAPSIQCATPMRACPRP